MAFPCLCPVAPKPARCQRRPCGPRPAGAQGPGRRGGGAGARGGAAARVNNVVTTAVGLATINDSLSAIGEGTAAHSVTVSSPAGGTLEELLVRPGDIVEAGDVIGRLDAVSEQIDYDRAVLAANDAKATLDRTQGLANSKVVATTALTAAQLAAGNADLELRNAENALQRRTITSPIAGSVGLMQVTPGNYVSPQTPVTTIDDTSSILVNFWVPERYAATIAMGAPVIGFGRRPARPGLRRRGQRHRQPHRSGQPHAAGPGLHSQ